ncbi:DUF3899 domain-containing protein [Macrococcus equipercicus]|uniref:DUF3899 domain-containing protein n=1 Tax=Macrococcus equipercicus TaxID=69967 RepID=A0ABQ6RBM0_9STAP|nr:DUF3899 domain-containing protein [Macrococcus equipercicus]KAA1042585.1 DUF3899 domain-containing protein [Macrococcus equipercicus]
MKRHFFMLSLLLLFLLTLILMLFNGFTAIGFIDSLFLAALVLFCLSLLILLFSDGAFSIMGHSFRRFHYMTAPKRVRETLEDDELYTRKDIKIRQQRYAITVPLLVTSSAALVLSLLLSYMQ